MLLFRWMEMEMMGSNVMILATVETYEVYISSRLDHLTVPVRHRYVSGMQCVSLSQSPGIRLAHSPGTSGV